MDGKKALTESGGDFDRTIEYLREKGLAAAAAKRLAALLQKAWFMLFLIFPVKLGVVVEVNAETDFAL